MTDSGQKEFDLDLCNEIPIPAQIVTHISKQVARIKSPTNRYANSTRNKIPHYTPTALSWCSREQFYILMQHQKEVLDADDAFASGFQLFRGNALHDAFARIYRWSELPFKFEFPISETKAVTISSRLDMYEPYREEILDLKTTKFLGWQKKSSFVPRIKDVRQLQIYEILYSKILPVKKLTLLYADMSELVAFNVPILKETQSWLKERIIKIETAIETKTPPPGEVTKLCDYCPFQTRCHADKGGIITKPKSHPEVNPQ